MFNIEALDVLFCNIQEEMLCVSLLCNSNKSKIYFHVLNIRVKSIQLY